MGKATIEANKAKRTQEAENLLVLWRTGHPDFSLNMHRMILSGHPNTLHVFESGLQGAEYLDWVAWADTWLDRAVPAKEPGTYHAQLFFAVDVLAAPAVMQALPVSFVQAGTAVKSRLESQFGPGLGLVLAPLIYPRSILAPLSLIELRHMAEAIHALVDRQGWTDDLISKHMHLSKLDAFGSWMNIKDDLANGLVLGSVFLYDETSERIGQIKTALLSSEFQFGADATGTGGVYELGHDKFEEARQTST